MEGLSFDNVKEWIEEIVKNEQEVLPVPDANDENLEYLSANGVTFTISKKDIKRSIKELAPNSDLVILVTKALRNDDGKDKLAEWLNNEWQQKTVKDTEPAAEPDEEEDENAIALAAMGVKPSTQVPVSVPAEDKPVYDLDFCAKGILLHISRHSVDTLKQDSVYFRLLEAVISGTGPKGEWLELILKNI